MRKDNKKRSPVKTRCGRRQLFGVLLLVGAALMFYLLPSSSRFRVADSSSPSNEIHTVCTFARMRQVENLPILFTMKHGNNQMFGLHKPPPAERLQEEMWKTQTFTYFQSLQWFQYRWKSPMLLLDIGANLGELSKSWVEASIDAGSLSTVYSVEPTSLCVDNLCAYSSLTHHGNGSWVVLEGVAGSEKRGATTSIFIPQGGEDNSASTRAGALANIGKNFNVTEKVVPVYNVDELIEKDPKQRKGTQNRATVLKVDTQGFEKNVLLGAKRALEEQRIDILYLENDDGLLRHNGASSKELFEMMQGFGYEGFHPNTLRLVTPTENTPGVLTRFELLESVREPPVSRAKLNTFYDVLWLPTGRKNPS